MFWGEGGGGSFSLALPSPPPLTEFTTSKLLYICINEITKENGHLNQASRSCLPVAELKMLGVRGRGASKIVELLYCSG